MRRSSIPLLALAIGLSSFLASCASSGPPAAAQKVRKERTVTVKVPVLVKESSYYSDGQLDGYVVYKYDPTNKFLVEKDSFDASQDAPMERVVSEWKNGLLGDDIYYDRDGKVKLRHDYGYDASRRLVSDKVSDGKGQPSSSSTYDYDAAGNKVNWRAFDGSGLLKAVTDYVHGSTGAEGKAPLLLIDMKDPAGVSTGTIKLSYDSDGNLLRRDYLGPDGSIQKSEIYVYASSAPGAPVAMELHRADGSLAEKTAYANGDLGQVLTATDSDGSGAVRGVTKYEYIVREDSVTQVYYE